MDNISALQYAF